MSGLEGIMADFPQLLHTAIDTTDARGLAEFYRELLGLRYRPGDEPPSDGTADDADWLGPVDGGGQPQLPVPPGGEMPRAAGAAPRRPVAPPNHHPGPPPSRTPPRP